VIVQLRFYCSYDVLNLKPNRYIRNKKRDRKRNAGVVSARSARSEIQVSIYVTLNSLVQQNLPSSFSFDTHSD
jgi:hypothetical protein